MNHVSGFAAYCGCRLLVTMQICACRRIVMTCLIALLYGTMYLNKGQVQRRRC